MTDLMMDSASACSLRLAKYIRDKTTIRSYVLANFGRAPSLQAIQSMIDEHRRIKRGDLRRGWYSSPQPSDALDWQPGSLVGTRTPKRDPVPQLVPAPPTQKLARMVPRAKVQRYATAIGPTQRVIDRAAELFAVPVADLIGKGRTRALAYPRQCVAYSIRTFSAGRISYPQIGSMLGNRDHSSIIHAVRKIEALVEADEWLQDIIAELQDAWNAQPRAEAA